MHSTANEGDSISTVSQCSQSEVFFATLIGDNIVDMTGSVW